MHASDERIDMIETARDYIIKLYDGIKMTVDYYRNNNDLEANKYMINIIDGLNWIMSVMNQVKDIHGVEDNSEGIRKALLEVVEAFKNTDYLLLGDILEYEIYPMIGEWKQILWSSSFDITATS